jgi:hypothetical protein
VTTTGYIDGVLRERWDDDARVYTTWDAGGVQTSQRPYTPEENARADAEAANRVTAEATSTLLQQLYAGVVSIQAARDAASNDVGTADGLQTQALTVKGQADTKRTQAAGFVASATYQPAQINALRDAIVDILDRQSLYAQKWADAFAYRKAVDQNAITTDDALLWLARYVSGRITG